MKKSILLFIVALTLGACSSQAGVIVSTFENITSNQLAIKMAEGDVLLINVHVPDEGNIPDTDLSIPYDQITENIEKFPQDKNAEIILYCRSGNMSSKAAQDLVNTGYTNVLNLQGGFNAWEQAGFLLEDN